MSGSWDPWRTAKAWTLLEASYICCGERPVTDEQRHLTKTAHPAHIHAMAQRLTAEVPYKEVYRKWVHSRAPGQAIFQREAVETWAKLNEFQLPWEASAASPSSVTPTDTLLRVVAALALALAEKSDRYRRGTKPNAFQIAEAVEDILAKLPDANVRGLSNRSIRDSISAGLSLLPTDDKTGKKFRPLISH